MKIVVDGWPLVTRSGGTGVYTRELLRRLLEADGANEYYLRGIARTLKRAGREDLVVRGPETGPQRILRNLAGRTFRRLRNSTFGDWGAALHTRREERTLARFGTDVYFGTSFLGMFHPSFKTVLTIHDLAYRYYPETINPLMFRVLSHHLRDHAQRADAILADSRHTKQDITSFLEVDPAKVSVVYPGVPEQYRPIREPAQLQEVRCRRGLPDRFLLFVGTVEPRKNIPVLIAAFELLCREANFSHGLVIAGGKGWQDQAIVAALENSRHRDRIVCTGFLPDDEMPVLYNLADVLVLPSLYEGFGFPVVEALACGTSVVASRVSSLPEVVGDAGLLFDPHSPEELTDALRRLLGDEALRQSLRARGFRQVRQFCWDTAARQAMDVFQQVTGNRV